MTPPMRCCARLQRLTTSKLAYPPQRRLLQTGTPAPIPASERRRPASSSSKTSRPSPRADQPPQELPSVQLHRRSAGLTTGASLPTSTLPGVLPSSPPQPLSAPTSSRLPPQLKLHSSLRVYSNMATPSDPKSFIPAEFTESENDKQEESDDDFLMPSVTNGQTFEDAYAKAFNNNSLWRRSLAETEPELFESLGKGQSPQILWIGCADSRCPETTILGLQPGEIFCHRNIANILVNTDINSLSVIQYAVQYLKVKHIIICGHTSCGGIAAALGNKKLGLIDTWLMPLRALRQENLPLLDTLNDTEKGLKMVELNVRAGVKVLHSNPIVIDAMSERGLQVHGLIYNVGSGELRELDIEEEEDIVKSRIVSFKTED